MFHTPSPEPEFSQAPAKDPPPPSQDKWLSRAPALFYILAVILLIFKHWSAAALSAAGAVFGPLIGRLSDLLYEGAVYILVLGTVSGILYAWMRLKNKIMDDGTLLDGFFKK